MLILHPKDVEYCYVKPFQTSQTEALPGVIYSGHLFIKVAAYDRQHFQNAIWQCRQFLEQHIPILTIVLKEPTGPTVWSEDKSLELIARKKQLATLQQVSDPENKSKLVMKYRGVEVVYEAKKLDLPHVTDNSKLRYRGHSYHQ